MLCGLNIGEAVDEMGEFLANSVAKLSFPHPFDHMLNRAGLIFAYFFVKDLNH